MSDHLYPDHPGWHQAAPDTSEQAAHEIAEDAATLRSRVLALFRRGMKLTSNEAAERLGRDPLSVQPRLSELVASGHIADSGQRRKNDTGKDAAVWELVVGDNMFAPPRPPEKSRKTLKAERDQARADVADLVEALCRIRIAAEFHAQDGVSDDVRRYAHESTKRLADEVLAKHTEANHD
jgi:predicted ArsR family transcriptional regulator